MSRQGCHKRIQPDGVKLLGVNATMRRVSWSARRAGIPFFTCWIVALAAYCIGGSRVGWVGVGDSGSKVAA